MVLMDLANFSNIFSTICSDNLANIVISEAKLKKETMAGVFKK